MKNHFKFSLIFAITVSFVLGAVLSFFVTKSSPQDQKGESDKKQPLYWVAPMDPNFRRDEPGKSPMGMDLIPVYDEGEKANDAGPGTINISPDVVNNLGVRTGLVERKTLHDEIVTVGYVQYDQDKLIHIHPRISGWIETLYVKAAGDPVVKDAPLYSLYAPELVNAQEELVLAMNRKNQRFIQAAEDRLRALQISENFIQKLKSDLNIQQNVTFYSPQDGVVDNLNIREGFFVQPGTTLFSIGALDEVWVEGEIFERQASLVDAGDPVTMTLDYLPGKTWTGAVEYIYPTLDSKTRTARIRLSFKNPHGDLKPNMFAQITVHADSENQLLVIPREALIRTGNQDRVVLALGEGSFKSVEVKVGRVDQSVVEIVEGLEEGERVVTSAQFLLDSESSKTSDFKRMHHADDKPSSVWVEGEIKSLMAEHRMVTASHAAVPEWEWPEMTMDFTVDKSLDISALKKGTVLRMKITEQTNNKYLITGIHKMEQAPANKKIQSARVNGIVNSIDHEKRVVNISRGAIEKWNRPAATMDFIAAKNINLSALQPGAKINFSFEIVDGEFRVVEIHASAMKVNPQTESQSDHGAMDHSTHEHSEMKQPAAAQE